MALIPTVDIDSDKLITEVTMTVDWQHYRIVSPRDSKWDTVYVSDRYIDSTLEEYQYAIDSNNPVGQSTSASLQDDNLIPPSSPMADLSLSGHNSSIPEPNNIQTTHIPPEDGITAGCLRALSLIISKPTPKQDLFAGENRTNSSKKEYPSGIESLSKKKTINKIKHVMRDNLYERRVLSKSGRLERNRLSHHRTSNRLFSKKEEQKGKTYHIDLVLDCSWSMLDEGNRAYHAIKSCLDIGEILDQVAHIRVICFGAVSTIYSYKEFKDICGVNNLPSNISECKLARLSWDEWYIIIRDGKKKLVNKKDYYIMNNTWLNPEVVSSKESTHYTDDLAAIVSSYHYMRKQDGDRCIIVILDGEYSPVEYKDCADIISMWYSRTRYNRDTYRETLSTVQKWWIGIYALAIESDCVHETRGPENYGRIWKVNDSSDIYPWLVDIITKFVTNI